MTKEFDAAVRDHGIVVFERRLITNAQPPISDKTLAEIEARCAGPLPDGLKGLWRQCFGGSVDYDLSVDFSGHIAAFSFNELFYPGSGGYHDLWGWIDHEARLYKMVAQEKGKTWSGKLGYLPFGGYDQSCRLYVCVEPGPEYGAVIAWTEGLPPAWRLNLHEDSIAQAADDVASLFRQLDLERDPFSAGADDYASGTDMAAKVAALSDKDPALADDLTGLIRETVLDWRGAVNNGDIVSHPRLRRVAMEHAASTGDIALIERLIALGCDINERFRGDAAFLDHAFIHDQIDAARWLIARGADITDAIINGAGRTPADLIADLLKKGARVSAEAVITAVDRNQMDSARLIADALAKSSQAAVKSTTEILARRVEGDEADAKRIEAREIISNLSAQQYRDRARRMRELLQRLKGLETQRRSWAPRDWNRWWSR